MAPLPIPTAGVRYRIQNVELSTCLERDSQGNVAMVRWRTSRQARAQQWTFDEVSNGIYNIINAEDQSYRLEASIASPPPGFTLTAQGPAPGTTQEWKVLVSNFKTFYLLNNPNILLHLDKDDGAVPKLTQDLTIGAATTGSILDRTKKPEDRWFITEDTPTKLADAEETYVIQTLKGDAIQCAASPHGPAQLLFKVSHLGDEHKWKIVDLGNGRANIRGILVDQFLDVQQVGSSTEWTPVLLKVTPPTPPPEWEIQKVGEFWFSITAKQTTPSPHALTVLDDVIVLKEYKNVPNQLWTLVPTDLASFKPLIAVSPTGRFPVGEYTLSNNLRPVYTWVDSAGTLQASLTDRGVYFKFDLAAGNDGVGLGNVFISNFSSYPSGFLTVFDDHHNTTRGSVRLYSPNLKDIWCVQMKAGLNSCFIVHVPTGRRLVCYVPNGNYQAEPQIGLEITNDTQSNAIWALIPKP
ncbi:hypothetical protein GALMADRAFT_255307 [Galerina marginata CBS 339.88]|uniref:Ricin B lectin domain-containing protein n=1 Tax=Galerina marginata (strain CBS 339.88) TaxID=685588 RepID=A0A067SQP0_GALM3|nr:hypothetical protein GALMADRAFT_255307 [Galerina marginata CBS 339.88]